MQKRFKVSVQRSCRVAPLQPSVWYAKSHARDQSALRLRMREIAMDRPRFDYRVLFMLKREGWAIGKKRVYQRGVKLDYARPGKPTDSGLIESLRAWQDDYNTCRPTDRSAT